jgi:hypothetical protein
MDDNKDLMGEVGEATGKAITGGLLGVTVLGVKIGAKVTAGFM